MGGDNPAEATLTTSATRQINNSKRYVPVVTLSINYNIQSLENLKKRCRRIVS